MAELKTQRRVFHVLRKRVDTHFSPFCNIAIFYVLGVYVHVIDYTFSLPLL